MIFARKSHHKQKKSIQNNNLAEPTTKLSGLVKERNKMNFEEKGEAIMKMNPFNKEFTMYKISYTSSSLCT